MDKQEKYELTITAKDVVSTDVRFTMADLGIGNNYKPLDVRFVKANGLEIRRKKDKSERKISNQTLPRLAFQIFEKQISLLSVEEKESYPVCQYRPTSDVITGIFSSVEEYRKGHNTLEYCCYKYDNGRMFVIYCWNIFSTIIFVQECLKLFGEDGDSFILTYRDKADEEDIPEIPDISVTGEGYRNPYSHMLLESKNIIFRGAPGTGKSYLAKEIAADIVSNGYYDKYESLSPEQKKQVEFVQFHPSYDYSDFVEGLRPHVNDDGSMGFERKDGVFKAFIDRARTNFENAHKSKEIREKEESAQEALDNFFSSIEFGTDTFKTINGNEFTIDKIDGNHIYISIPGNAIVNKLTLNMDELRKLLESGEKFDKRGDVTKFFGKKYSTQQYSYDFILFHEIKKKTKKLSKLTSQQEQLKKYIFIIYEINRGEISKIFGELFFSIDPGYRGESGAVSTQYANMHGDPDKKFYIPDNFYIIGTMNDIDRSVDTFDFAMRRRFRFIELKADDRVEMLDDLGDDSLSLCDLLFELRQLVSDRSCSHMAEHNKRELTGDINEVIRLGYSPCKWCNPT